MGDDCHTYLVTLESEDHKYVFSFRFLIMWISSSGTTLSSVVIGYKIKCRIGSDKVNFRPMLQWKFNMRDGQIITREDFL